MTRPAAPARPRSKRKSSSLDTITAALVARQSRTDDGTMSVPDQIDAMTAWCAAQTPPVEIGNVYTEYDTSGRKPLDKRKGLLKAVEDVEGGRAQMVLTAYFDRFVRSVMTRAEVLIRVEEKHGGTVMTMDFGKTSNATPVSKFTGTILAAVGEYIAEQSGEKTAVTKQRNIDNGIPPFPRITPAYVKVASGPDKGRLRMHPVNGPLIREACKMRARGMSYSKIVHWLDEQGLTMTMTGLETTLASRLLIGEIHFGDFTPNLHAVDEDQIVIDRATFARMQKAKVSRGRYSKSSRLLARLGVLVCKTCDARMTVHSTTSGGKKYEYYSCGNQLCKHPATISAPFADDFVRDEAIELSKHRTVKATRKSDVEAARLAVVEIGERLSATIETLSVTGTAGHKAARTVLAELQEEYGVAEARHARLLARSAPARVVNTARDWNALSLEHRRGVVHATIARAVVTPSVGRRGPRVVPGRIVIEPRGSVVSE